MREHDALAGAVMKEPSDPLHKLALADFLEETGCHADAHAFRWMARRGKHPHHRRWYPPTELAKAKRVPDQYSWAWHPAGLPRYRVAKLLIPHAALLPRLVYLSVAHGGEQRLYGSFWDAVRGLSEGLDALRKAHLAEEG